MDDAELRELYLSLLARGAGQGQSSLNSLGVITAAFGAVFFALARGDLGSVQFLLPGLTPLVPLTLLGWFIYEHNSMIVESYFARVVEDELLRRSSESLPAWPIASAASASRDDPSELPAYSYFNLQQSAQSPRHVQGTISALVLTGLLTTVAASVGCVLFAISKTHDLAKKYFDANTSLGFVHFGAQGFWHHHGTDVITGVFLATYTMYLVLGISAARRTTVRGSRIWAATLLDLDARRAGPSPAADRSLLSYCVWPRRGELLSKSLLQLSAVVILARSLDVHIEASRVVVAFVGFDFLVYQARYMLNDYRDRDFDATTHALSTAHPRSRLPLLDSTTRHVFFWTSLCLRFAAGVVLVAMSAGSAGHAGTGLGALLAIVLATIGYELLKAWFARTLPRIDRWRDNFVAVVSLLAFVAVGYAARPLVYLAVIDVAFRPGALLVLGAGLALLGVFSIGMTWALEGTADLYRGPNDRMWLAPSSSDRVKKASGERPYTRALLLLTCRGLRVATRSDVSVAGPIDDQRVFAGELGVWTLVTSLACCLAAVGVDARADFPDSWNIVVSLAASLAAVACVSVIPRAKPVLAVVEIVVVIVGGVAIYVELSGPALVPWLVLLLTYASLVLSSRASLHKAYKSLEDWPRTAWSSLKSVPNGIAHAIADLRR